MSNDRSSLRRGLLALLAAGWLLGLAVQVATRVATGYGDVFPPQILLASLLCFGAGATARVAGATGHTVRTGALAGMAMIGSIVLGYALLMVILWNPAWSEQSGGETWFSLLLEAPFWIGIPALIGAGLGALGWQVADRRLRRS